MRQSAKALQLGTAAGQALPGNDLSVTNARPPTGHAGSHNKAGNDPVSLSGIGILDVNGNLLVQAATGAPAAPTAPTDNGAGNVNAGPHDWVWVYVTANGKSIPSAHRTYATATGGTGARSLTFTAPAFPSGVTSMELWRSTAGSAVILGSVGTVNASGGTIVDNLADTSLTMGTPPAVDQTGGSLSSALHATSHGPGQQDELVLYGGHRLSTTSVETVPRWAAQSTLLLATGTEWFTCFTPNNDLSISKFVLGCSAVASGLTLARIVLYALSGTTFYAVAQTPDVHAAGCTILGGASNVGLFSSQGVAFTVAITMDGSAIGAGNTIASFLLRREQRYAVGIEQVGTTGGTTYICNAPQWLANNINLLPVMAWKATAAADALLSASPVNNTTAAMAWVAIQ